MLATLSWWCNWPAFSGWERAEVLSAIAVAIGCVGEMWWLFKKGPPSESFIVRTSFDKKKEKREKLFAILIAAGVTAEVITLLHGLKESGLFRVEFAQLQQANLVLRSNVAALESQALETKTRVAKIDPKKQAILSIEANAIFFVRGTNSFRELLSSYDSTSFGSGWLHLVSSSTRGGEATLIGDKPDRFGGVDDVEISLRYHMGGGSPRMHAAFLTVEDSKRWDRVWLDPIYFLRQKSEVTHGFVWVIINNTMEKYYCIPPQTFGFWGQSPTIVGVLTNSPW